MINLKLRSNLKYYIHWIRTAGLISIGLMIPLIGGCDKITNDLFGSSESSSKSSTGSSSEFTAFFNNVEIQYNDAISYGTSPLTNQLSITVTFSPKSPTITLQEVSMNLLDSSNQTILAQNIQLYDDGQHNDVNSGDYIYSNIINSTSIPNYNSSATPEIYFKVANNDFKQSGASSIAIDTISPPTFSINALRFNDQMVTLNIELSLSNQESLDITNIALYRQNTLSSTLDRTKSGTYSIGPEHIFSSSSQTLIKRNLSLDKWKELSTGYYTVELLDTNKQSSVSDSPPIYLMVGELPNIRQLASANIPMESPIPPSLGSESIDVYIQQDSLIVKKITGQNDPVYYEYPKDLNSVSTISASSVTSTIPAECQVKVSVNTSNRINLAPCISSDSIYKDFLSLDVEQVYLDELYPDQNRWPSSHLKTRFRDVSLQSFEVVRGGQSTNGPYITEFLIDDRFIYTVTQNGYGPGAYSSFKIKRFQWLD